MHKGKRGGGGGRPSRGGPPVEAADDTDRCGLMKVSLESAPLNLLLELYLREIVGRLDQEIRGVTLYGSAALHDLAPSHGDIDLLVALRRGAGSFARRELAATHEYLARPAFAPWGGLLEVRYVPWAGLEGADDAPQGVLVRGTGMTSMGRPYLTPLDLYLAREGGVALHGEALTALLPLVHKGDLLAQALSGLRDAQGLGDGDDAGPYLKVYLGVVRILAVVQMGRPVSKSEAAQWFAGEVKGKAGDLVTEAARIRRGELKVPPDALRRGLPLFLTAVKDEIDRLSRARS